MVMLLFNSGYIIKGFINRDYEEYLMTKREPSSKSIGFQDVAARSHEYSIYLGDTIRVHTPNMAYQGVLIAIRDGLMYLNPALVRQDLPLTPSNGDYKSEYHAVLQRRKPTTVVVERVEGVELLTEDYLPIFARRLNEVGRRTRLESERRDRAQVKTKSKPRSSR
jgi:hypothetical protein